VCLLKSTYDYSSLKLQRIVLKQSLFSQMFAGEVMNLLSYKVFGQGSVRNEEPNEQYQAPH